MGRNYFLYAAIAAAFNEAAAKGAPPELGFLPTGYSVKSKRGKFKQNARRQKGRKTVKAWKRANHV